MKAAGLLERQYCAPWFQPAALQQYQNGNCAKDTDYLAHKKEFEKNFKPQASMVVHLENSASKLRNNGIVWEHDKGYQKPLLLFSVLILILCLPTNSAVMLMD